jgi:hypothetical protein
MTGTVRRLALAAPVLFALATGAQPAVGQTPRTNRVVLIVTDGFRWQELFRGADPALINPEYGQVEDTAAVRKAYLVGNAEANRRALMPFLWEVVARNGQIYGNRDAGSTAVVTNGMKFSYPGYNEMLTGRPDPRIDRNDYGPNPNVTVFEWLAGQPGFTGGVAAFGTWDAFAPIFNRDRAPMTVHAGWDPPFPGSSVPARVLLDSLYATTTRVWSEMPFDSYLQSVVTEYLNTERPLVLYMGFGETDEWAHEGRYDRYLATAHRVDGYIRDLWLALQARPEYVGTTTFIITTDHGRGSGLKEWRNHGANVEGAEYVWMAVMGPDTPALGERHNVPQVTQSQIAATVAAAVGMDWVAASGAAAPLPSFGGIR